MAVLAWGANSHGQLAIGLESELCIEPQKVLSLPLNPNSIKKIKGGGGHVVVLDNRGQLYSSGWNNRGQLGQAVVGNSNDLQPIPLNFFNGAPISDFACGWDMSGAITIDSQAFVWGSNSFQQLGLCKRGFTFVSQPYQLQLPKDEIPKKISFGMRHCCVLSKENNIYVFGKFRLNPDSVNDSKCCMISCKNTEVLRIKPEITVKMIASGQNHILISDGKKIIAYGDNKYGQANAFECEDSIKQLVAGWTHNGFLTNKNEVYLWGRNSYGQLGHPATTLSIAFPTKLELNAEMVPHKLYLGAEHGLILTKEGQVLAWGWNEHGNCGNGSTENLYSPTLVDLPGACKVAGVGAGFNFVVCDV